MNAHATACAVPTLLGAISFAALSLAITACGKHSPAPGVLGSATAATAAAVSAVSGDDDHAGHDHGKEPDSGGAIAVPELVRQNLGLTWARAEYRVVQGVIRLPGRFESEPTARRPYHVPLAGQIELLVTPYQRVSPGTPLYRLQAPGWNRLQQELAEASAALMASMDQRTATTQQVGELSAAVSAWEQRVARLDKLDESVGGKAAERTDAATRLAELRITLAEVQRQAAAAVRQVGGADPAPSSAGEAHLRVRLLLTQAAQFTGLSLAELTEIRAGMPTWATLAALEVRAAAAGVVEGDVVASGSWAAEHTTVLMVIDPTGVRLRAAGLQADLPRLREGMTARIVATDPALSTAIAATVVISPVADASDRSVAVIARPLMTGRAATTATAAAALPIWVRPGVTANLELVLSGSADEELAIPVAATIRDGLDMIFFRRDPARPDQVLRVVADLGASDGRWVVVQSGMKENDQVVEGGIRCVIVTMTSRAPA